LSYDGRIVKIHWCVRVRVFQGWGRELVLEEPFTLGTVPPPRELASRHDEEDEE
jgi:hypothetical protein